MNVPRVQVLSMEPDADGRFPVYYAGYQERWSIDRIKRHVAEGGDLTAPDA